MSSNNEYTLDDLKNIKQALEQEVKEYFEIINQASYNKADALRELDAVNKHIEKLELAPVVVKIPILDIPQHEVIELRVGVENGLSLGDGNTI